MTATLVAPSSECSCTFLTAVARDAVCVQCHIWTFFLRAVESTYYIEVSCPRCAMSLGVGRSETTVTQEPKRSAGSSAAESLSISSLQHWKCTPAFKRPLTCGPSVFPLLYVKQITLPHCPIDDHRQANRQLVALDPITDKFSPNRHRSKNFAGPKRSSLQTCRRTDVNRLSALIASVRFTNINGTHASIRNQVFQVHLNRLEVN